MKDLRTIIFFTAFLFAWTTSWAVAPYGFRGQNQTAVQYSNVLQFPNNQVTKIGGINSLVETGNRNILVNPSFEHETFSTSWTSAGTATNSAETSSPLSGKKSFRISASAQTIQVYQDSTLYAGVLAGTQGVIRFSASTTNDVDTTVCQRAAGVELTGANNCVTLVAGGVKRNYEIPVVLSATSNGVEVSSASTTGVTILDDFEISDSLSLPEVAQPVQAVSAYFAGTTNCLWTRASTTVGAFSADADCPGPTIESFSVGTWATTDVDLPRLTGSNLPAGKYIFTVTTPVAGSTTNANSLTINDGASNCVGVGLGGTITASTLATFKCEFNYTSPQASKPFELYGSATTGSVNISNDSASGAIRPTKIQIQYEPPASKIYSQKCTSAVGCENVFSAKVSAAGVVSGENLDWINGNCPITATSDFTCTFNSSIFTVTPNCTVQTTGGENRNANILSASSSSLPYRTEVATTQADTAYPVDIICQKQGVDFKEKSQITGTFREVPTTPGYSNPVTYKTLNGGSAATLTVPTVCAASPCVEVEDINSKWSACTRSGAGVYQCIAANGTWANSVSVECECESFSAASGQVSDCSPYNNGNQTWQTNSSGGLIIGINTATKAGVSTDSYFSLWCRANGP